MKQTTRQFRCAFILCFLVLCIKYVLAVGQVGLAPRVSAPTSTSLLVEFQPHTSFQTQDVLAYEVSQRSLVNSHWEVINNAIGSQGNSQDDVQIVSVRADIEAPLTSGTFTLALQFSHLLGEDFEKLARTKPIPWNATATQFQSALQALGGVRVKEVRRCDLFGDKRSDIGHGGAYGWVHGCSHGAAGGFKWLVIFDTLAAGLVPTLYPFRNLLGSGYKGPGPQIAVTHIRRGFVNPSLCSPVTCSLNVTGLREDTLYSFRVRALSAVSGWSDFSLSSPFVSTQARKAPSRPLPPQLASSLPRELLLEVVASAAVSNASGLEVQFRRLDETMWTSLPPQSLAQPLRGNKPGSYIVSVPFLTPDTSYQTRARLTNEVGVSPFSAVSTTFKTLSDDQAADVPLAPVIPTANSTYVPVSGSWVDVLVSSNPRASQATVKPSLYRLQYKGRSDLVWRTWPDVMSFTPRRPGVSVQAISTRISVLDRATSCSGYFWLQLGVSSGSVPSWTTTPPISITASESELRDALMSMGVIKAAAPRIKVRRHSNVQNGLTWTVEIEGMGRISNFQLKKHTFVSEHIQVQTVDTSATVLPSFRNSTIGASSVSVITGPCWQEDPVRPVVIKAIQYGDDVHIDSQAAVRVSGLKPEETYEFRVQSIDDAGRETGLSNVTSVTTLPANATLQVKFGDALNGMWSTYTRPPLGISGDSRREPVAAPQDNILEPSVMVPGYSSAPAKQHDYYYLSGVGLGGLSGQDGSAGHCVLTSFNPGKQPAFQSQRFFFTGKEQTYRVSRTAGEYETTAVSIKCWGAGGGGARLSDLSESTNVTFLDLLSVGGGGAFAQIGVHVRPSDVLTIIIGGGGSAARGERGGDGGYGGGGRGGDGLMGGGGGGGGGASIVRRGSEVLLVAAGGGGGGSTDYCCAHGGAAGASEGYNGTYPGSSAPWPITSSAMPTEVSRRFEYTSSACPNDVTGDFCISEWDTLPETLPAEHKNLQYGMNPEANYSIWATSGQGGQSSVGGAPGISGSFGVRLTGSLFSLSFGQIAVYAQGKGLEVRSIAGARLQGGSGGEGKQGGGGGGGGWWGGGGGGSGIDAAGGGGGSSYINISSSSATEYFVRSNRQLLPQVTYVNDTGVILQWTFNWDRSEWGIPSAFEITMAPGIYSANFQIVEIVSTTQEVVPFSNTSTGNTVYVGTYSLQNLDADSQYRVKLTPLFSKGRGRPSDPLTVRTLKPPASYWEPLIPRRISLAASGRGFSNPVLRRPHLDPGVEIYAKQTSQDTLRFSDPATAVTPAFPSGRRGQSFSLVDDLLYMFGGRTDGYSCALVFKDFLNYGATDSGLFISPCNYLQGEVNELWKLNVHTYQWEAINVTLLYGTPSPPPREQHSAAVIDGDIFIFGGKTRIFPSNPNGSPKFEFRRDVVMNDMWKLTVQHAFPARLTWPNPTLEYDPADATTFGSLQIPSDRRLFIELNGSSFSSKLDKSSARTGNCVDRLVIKVVIFHQCINQVRLSVMGPGSQTASPNFHSPSASHEVVLLDQPKTNGTGCVSGVHEFIFDDSSPNDSNACCRTSPFSGDVRAQGRLAEFIGASPAAMWTLVVQDMRQDDLSGRVLFWSPELVLSPCVRSYAWTNMSGIAKSFNIPARYQAKSIVYGKSMFLYGGLGLDDVPLTDLHRFDAATNTWTTLQPVGFNIALDVSTSVGANFMLGPWGLIRYGGLMRQYSASSQYLSMVNVFNPVTQKWTEMSLSAWPFPDSRIGATTPPPRYLASSAFISSQILSWKAEFSYRTLYDRPKPSTYSNYAGATSDSLLVFGGFDGAPGSVFDGSSGGLLTDMWMARLTAYSTPTSKQTLTAYLAESCLWRNSSSAINSFGTQSCLGNGAGSTCQFRDLLMLVWCAGHYQTVS